MKLNDDDPTVVSAVLDLDEVFLVDGIQESVFPFYEAIR